LQKKGIIKICLIISGLFFISLGMIGIIIPGLPTTVFLIVAAACFAKSSPCLHAWLMYHPWFGPVLSNWQQSRSIPKNAKVIALLSMLVAAVYTSIALDNIYLIIGILLAMVLPAIFLFRLPLSEESQAAQNRNIVNSSSKNSD
jgi:uncharacterized membrane protein YbaN (DUF454 family)